MFNCVIVTFPCGILGQVWYLIVSIPDLCCLSYFKPLAAEQQKMKKKIIYIYDNFVQQTPGRVAQSVTCLATDACLTAGPGVVSSIPARSHTFVEIDHEIISTVILLPSADSFKKGCCQLQANMCTNYWLTACSSCPGKSVVR